MSVPPPPASSSGPLFAGLAEVRFSLPQLLEEIKIERATGSYSMEKLDQHEIGKLFKAKARAKRKK